MRHRLPVWLLALIAGVLPASAPAHDFWLVPVTFRVSPGETLRVLGQTGMEFPKSVGAVDPARVAEARLLGGGEDAAVTDLTRRDSSLVLRLRPHAPGQRVVALRTRWRHVPESAESFRRYLELEGAGTLRERYEREGLLPADSVVRRYAKYAKALVEVGSGPRAFGTMVGHPLEFVPLADPAAAAGGDTLRLRLLFAGSPLPGAVVHAGAAPERGRAGVAELLRVTDAAGEVALPIARAGIWNARSLHIVPAAPGEDADWDVHWASVVFEVGSAPNRRGARERPGRGGR